MTDSTEIEGLVERLDALTAQIGACGLWLNIGGKSNSGNYGANPIEVRVRAQHSPTAWSWRQLYPSEVKALLDLVNLLPTLRAAMAAERTECAEWAIAADRERQAKERAESKLAAATAPLENGGWPGEGAHPIETLWREVGLPEYFLGNGKTNHKLYALYDRIRALSPPEAAVSRDGETAAQSPLMQRSREAAERVKTWSPAKQEYARRMSELNKVTDKEIEDADHSKTPPSLKP
jgi:hypothetical protein